MFRHLYQNLVKRPTLPRIVIGTQHFSTSPYLDIQQQILGHSNIHFKVHQSKETIDEYGNTKLMWYCFHGTKHKIPSLLGIKTNLFNNKHYNALMIATLRNHIDVVQYLLSDETVDLNIQNTLGTNALMIACEHKLLPIVELFVRKKATINDQNNIGFTPLIFAVIQEHLPCITHLVKSGADINLSSHSGNTPLMKACHIGNAEIVTLLLYYEANLELQNHDGKTALMIAAHQEHDEIVELLLSAGANPDTQDHNGSTALIQASSGKNKLIIQHLIDANADVNIIDYLGYEALDYAQKISRSNPIMEILNDAKHQSQLDHSYNLNRSP